MLMSVFGALAFVAAVFGLIVALAAMVYLLATHRSRAAWRVATWTLVGVAAYFAMLLTVSVTSAAPVLGINEEQRFCAADCDLAFSVTNVQKADTLGDPPNQATPQGVFYIVTVKMRSDAARVTMQFNDPISIRAGDDQGNKYGYSPEGQKALDQSPDITGTLQLPWVSSLAPGESASRDIVFDLPRDTADPVLYIIEGGWPTRFIIGDENSFLHKRTVIRLGP
jgi:hypothetical protein